MKEENEKKYVEEALRVIKQAVEDIATTDERPGSWGGSVEIAVSFGKLGTVVRVDVGGQQGLIVRSITDPVNYHTAFRARTFKPRKDGSWNVKDLRLHLIGAAETQLRVAEQIKTLTKNTKSARELKGKILRVHPWADSLVSSNVRSGSVTISIVTTSFHAASDVLNALYTHLDPKELKSSTGKDETP
jgi:hypothetical protein